MIKNLKMNLEFWEKDFIPLHEIMENTIQDIVKKYPQSEEIPKKYLEKILSQYKLNGKSFLDGMKEIIQNYFSASKTSEFLSVEEFSDVFETLMFYPTWRHLYNLNIVQLLIPGYDKKLGDLVDIMKKEEILKVSDLDLSFSIKDIEKNEELNKICNGIQTTYDIDVILEIEKSIFKGVIPAKVKGDELEKKYLRHSDAYPIEMNLLLTSHAYFPKILIASNKHREFTNEFLITPCITSARWNTNNKLSDELMSVFKIVNTILKYMANEFCEDCYYGILLSKNRHKNFQKWMLLQGNMELITDFIDPYVNINYPKIIISSISLATLSKMHSDMDFQLIYEAYINANKKINTTFDKLQEYMNMISNEKLENNIAFFKNIYVPASLKTANLEDSIIVTLAKYILNINN